MNPVLFDGGNEMADFQALVGKALSDEAFVEALVANPEATLREAGFEPTPEILDALQGVDVAAVKKLAAAFGEDQAA
jgi:hypothetical protein